ncbi:MAG: trimethylamine methyltransferase family protein [Anaerolineales bacterium]|nr:trimethylamine methyltransferase family protein [Anaerolineales bacterium]
MIQSRFSPVLTPGLHVLSPPQIEEIHRATLEVLRRTGVIVRVDDIRARMKAAGCWVDGERVFIPPHLVEWAIRIAPKRVVLCDRNGAARMHLEGRKGYYGTGSDTPFVIDPRSGERRKAVLDDIRNVARLVDALEHIDFLMCMGIASDVTESISDIHHFKAMLENTEKPIIYTAWNRDNLEGIIAMAEAVAGGEEELRRKPFCALYSEPISPLTHAEESGEKLLYIAGKGLPVVYTPGMQIGGTAPVTLAGALVQANAEQLSGLLICQLIREGAPVICGGGILFMDMTQGLISYAAPEFMLAMTAFSELCHYYQLPIFSFSGCSDSKMFDEQSAAEGAIWMMLTALSGGNLIHDVGYIESGLTASYDQITAMDEIAGLVKRFMGGVEVTEETLAVEVIDRVGPMGHFLADDHTFAHFRENWVPSLLDRSTFADWKADGAQSLRERVRERVLSILEHHEPTKISDGISSKLETILASAEARVS